jgi:hypothetical protein
MEPPAPDMPSAFAERIGVTVSRRLFSRWLRVGVKLILAVLFALLPLIFALVLDINDNLAGFLDGAITDYEKAMMRPDRILKVASIAVSCYLFYKSLRANHKRTSLVLGYHCLFT